MKIVLDSNIVIEVLKGNNEIIKHLTELNSNDFYVTYITIMEVLFGARNKVEKEKIKKFLFQFKILYSNKIIGEQAIEYIDQFSLSHGASLPDMIIASIVIVNNAFLMTLNVKDFKYIPNLRLYK